MPTVLDSDSADPRFELFNEIPLERRVGGL